jgi:hypothetical protein
MMGTPTKLEKMGAAYDKAKAKPTLMLHVHSAGTMSDDSSWRKEQKARKKAELKALQDKIDNFDRDKAADAVLSALMREKKQAELDAERECRGIEL